MAKGKMDDWEARFSKITSEFTKNTKETLSSLANRFDLISRDEFKVQQDLLAEAVKKLSAIEARLDEMAGKKPAKKAAGKKKKAKASKKPKTA